MSKMLHQVFLMVTDIDASVSFYTETIGLTLQRQGDRSAEFETGTCALMIEEDFDAETLAGFGLEPPTEKRGDGVIVVLEVDDVNAVHERAAKAGATILAPPREVDWGRILCLLRDPDGYTLEISKLTEDTE